MLILKAYFIVFIELDLTSEAIELAEMENRKPLDMIVGLLQDWMDGQNATVRRLYRAFRECNKDYNKLIGMLYCVNVVHGIFLY